MLTNRTLFLSAITGLVAILCCGPSRAEELAFADGLTADDATLVGFECDDVCCGCCDNVSGDECCNGVGCCDGCGDSCGVCCRGSCTHCCLENNGLLGLGIAPYDYCGDGCAAIKLLLKPFAATEEGFDDFISPTSNPLFFEDPRLVTEARVLVINHKFPLATGGEDLQLYAVQLRARLTERLALVASRDGYIVSQNPLVGDGFADVDAGLKMALYRDVENQRLLSAGAIYDIPVGTPDALQANGDGEFHLFLTGGTEFMDCGHWLSQLGGILPLDANANSSFVYWSNHWDYQVRKGWYAIGELNWFHYTDGGDGGIPGVEGLDFVNLGSSGVDGNDVVTGAFGLTYMANKKTQFSLAWELPLSGRRDILENRINLNIIMRK